MLQRQLGHATAVDRDVDVLARSATSEQRRDLEDVLSVGREVVGHDHATAGTERRALDVIPRVLGDVDGARVLGGRGQGARIPDGQSADLGRRAQVGLEQRGREALRGGQVVEVAEVGVRRQPAAGLDIQIEQLGDDSAILSTVETLEAPGTGIGVDRGRSVDHALERLNQLEQAVGRRTPVPRRRHHFGPELEDHPLGRFGRFVGPRDVEALEREVAGHPRLAVTAYAVALDDVVELFDGVSAAHSMGGWGRRDRLASCREPDAHDRDARCE